MSDSSRCGVLESQTSSYWAVRFADKSKHIVTTDLKLLQSDAASFEPSQAPLSSKERLRARSSAPESTRKRRRVVKGTAARGAFAEGKAPEGTVFDRDTDSDCDECPRHQLLLPRPRDQSVADSAADSDCDECPALEVLDAATALFDCTRALRDVPR